MKKYENLVEMAFRLAELGNPFNGQLTVVTEKEVLAALDNLRSAATALKEFRLAGEPIFVLRGQDRVAPKAIVAWGQFVSSASGTGLAGEHASQEHDQMLAWQEAHPDLVKMPD